MKSANAVERAATSFDAGNSTLMLLLGALSCARSVERALPPPAAPGGPRRTRPAAATPTARPILLDEVTLAILGLLAAGARLTDACAGARDQGDRELVRPGGRRGRGSSSWKDLEELLR